MLIIITSGLTATEAAEGPQCELVRKKSPPGQNRTCNIDRSSYMLQLAPIPDGDNEFRPSVGHAVKAGVEPQSGQPDD